MEPLFDAARRAIERSDKMANEMERARAVSRDVVFRMVVLAATIVAFSATALSIENLDVNVNEALLKLSWLLFAAAVLIGPLSIYIESRAQYAVTWRGNQLMEFDQEPATWRERVKMLAVLLYTVFLRPRNLIYCRHTDVANKRTAWINGTLVQQLHVVWDVALALELLFWLVFVGGLVALIAAVGF